MMAVTFPATGGAVTRRKRGLARGIFAVALVLWLLLGGAGCSEKPTGPQSNLADTPDAIYGVEFFSKRKMTASYTTAHYRQNVRAGDHAIIRMKRDRLKKPLITVRLLRENPDDPKATPMPKPTETDITATIGGQPLPGNVARLRQLAAAYDVVFSVGDRQGECRVDFHRPFLLAIHAMDIGEIEDDQPEVSGNGESNSEFVLPAYSTRYFTNTKVDLSNAVPIQRCCAQAEWINAWINRRALNAPLIVVKGMEGKPLRPEKWLFLTEDGTEQILNRTTIADNVLTFRFPVAMDAVMIEPAVGDCFNLEIVNAPHHGQQSAAEAEIVTGPPPPAGSDKSKINPTVPPCFP